MDTQSIAQIAELDYASAHDRLQFNTFVSRREPVVLRNMGQHCKWPALSSWTPDGLCAMAKRNDGMYKLPINVAISVEERQGPTRKMRVLFGDFIKRLALGEPDTGYLKQVECSFVFPHNIKRDLDPVSTLFPDTLFPTVYLWAGPSGCVTGCHSDDEKNLLVQLHGRKRVTVVPKKFRKFLYENKKYDSGTTCCDVDVENPDLEKHPDFGSVLAAGSDGRQNTILFPGDVLFMPRGIFHQVRSESTCVSANFFCSNAVEWLREGVPRGWFSTLHKLGLHRNGNCVCHQAS